MFGTNEITKAFPREDGGLLVNDIFYTIQGEGPDAGQPAIFLRLAKCNLRCFFCDTEFERGDFMSLGAVYSSVFNLSDKHGCRLVVITGGEPLLQNIVPLIHYLNKHGIRVSIETAGTVTLPHLSEYFGPESEHYRLAANLIVVSPKTPRIHPEIERIMGAYKYIINAPDIDPEDDLPGMSTQAKGQPAKIVRPKDGIPVYVQAMDVGDEKLTHVNLLMAATIAMRRGYRLSVQIHKLAELP